MGLKFHQKPSVLRCPPASPGALLNTPEAGLSSVNPPPQCPFSSLKLEDDLRENLHKELDRLHKAQDQVLKNQGLLLLFENGVDNLIMRLCSISVPGQVRGWSRPFLLPPICPSI